MKTIKDIFASFEDEPRLGLRTRRILQLRFAIGVKRDPSLPKAQYISLDGIPLDENGHTRKEIGDILGLTPERIRQIEAKAIHLLIHPERFEKIIGFINDTPPSEDAIKLMWAICPTEEDFLRRFNRARQYFEQESLNLLNDDPAAHVRQLCYGSDETPARAGSPHGNPRGPRRDPR